jgi:hypothetical protein
MVKFVRLPFYEQSDMKRLSRTNPRFIGMPAPISRGLHGYMVTCLPRESGVTLPAVALAKAGMIKWLHACPDFSGVTWLHGYMVKWLNS